MIKKDKIKKRRKERLRKKIKLKQRIFGTPEKPRVIVFRSNKHLYASVVNDLENKVLFTVSTLNLKNVKGTKTEKAKELGKLLAKKCIENNINKIVFDRNTYKYHGRIKALAEIARSEGLLF